jgi:hypothetical protein
MMCESIYMLVLLVLVLRLLWELLWLRRRR